MALGLIVSDDLSSEDIVCQIAEKVTDKQYLYLCASKNTKDVRSGSGALSSQPYTSGCKSFNLATFAELIRHLQRDVFSSAKCIRVSDERYILARIIDYMFTDTVKKNVFSSMRYQLHELYQFLLFHDVFVSDDAIHKIGINYSAFESDVFTLYNLFSRTITTVSTGNTDGTIPEILAGLNLDKGYDTVINRTKKAIEALIDTVDTVILDGFFTFSEIQMYLLKYALEQNKDVYLTAKRRGYLTDEVYPSLFVALNQEYPKLLNEEKVAAHNTALQFIQYAYGDFSMRAQSADLLQDGSIQMISPFPNREMEWRYLIEQMSLLLRTNCGKDIVKLKNMIKDDIAFAMAYSGYEEPFDAILKDIGVFIYKGESAFEGILGDKRVVKTFDDVYFERSEFMNEEICFVDGMTLTYSEKQEVFDKTFQGIKRKKVKTSITAYPVGQYVFKIYEVLLNGISTDAFKILLYSNWQHNIQTDAVKWDKYLNDFKTLEVFFDGKTDLDAWITLFRSMLAIKKESDYLLKNHPVTAVAESSLVFFLDILSFIKNLIAEIGKVNGSIAEHLNMLKHTVMSADKFALTDESTFEQKIIMELIEAVDSITASSLLKNVPAKYFAENLQAMLKDFESDGEEITDDRGMLLNIVKLENITHYKYSFFPMFEAGKYPRRHVESFPFNTDIIEILRDPLYGIECVPSDYRELQSHIKLEEYLFMNALSFTDERLIITMTQKEDERKNNISHYAHDIASMFNSDIFWVDAAVMDSSENPIERRKAPALYLPRKEKYTLKELVTLKLCPRLYYHSVNGDLAFKSKFQLQFYFVAVLFSATMNEFKKYNYKNKKIYRTNNREAYDVAKSFFTPAYEKYLPVFQIFTDYELSDIRNTVHKKINAFFSDLGEKGIKGSSFTVVGVDDNPKYVGDGYSLVLEYDTKIYDMENRVNRISQNDIFLDFLVLKTADDERDPLKHYADMLAALAQNRPNCDRVNLAYKMIGKINIQFDSGKYAGDGIKRTDALVEDICRTNFSYAKPYASKFCPYCPINDICKERAVSR